MECLSSNPYYFYLKNSSKRQYEDASLNQLTICIPEANSTIGVEFSPEFVDSHILKPFRDIEMCMVSMNGIKYESKESELILLSPEQFIVNIKEKFTAYNSEGASFHIWIVDKPIDPIYKPLKFITEIQSIEITTYVEAVNFLNSNTTGTNEVLTSELLITNGMISKEMAHTVQGFIKRSWANLISTQSKVLQRNGHFQYLLSKSLEIIVAENLYNHIISNLNRELQVENENIFKKCKQLSDMHVTVQQLGEIGDYIVPCPAAIVEFATLDADRSPIGKLMCLKTTYDLVLAEWKGAVVEIMSETTGVPMPTITKEIIHTMLMYVIIRAKPLHLESNLHYIKHFQWTNFSNAELRSCLEAFEYATSQIVSLNERELLPCKQNPLSSLSLEDLMIITSEAMNRFNREGLRTDTNVSSIDLHNERIAFMIEAATLPNIT